MYSNKQLTSSVFAVVTEVGFNEIYLNQPLFSELDQFRRSKGFYLFDLQLGRRWSRKELTPLLENLQVGQLIYGEAVYMKDPFINRESDLSNIQLLKMASLAEFFSILDFAIEILEYAESKNMINIKEKDFCIELLLSNQEICD